MIIPLLSIFVLTIFVWVINKKLPIQICPICAGVSLTWLWMLFGMSSGMLSIEKYQLMTAILMGGSIVGITNKLEEKYKIQKARKIIDGNDTKTKALKKQLDNCC